MPQFPLQCSSLSSTNMSLPSHHMTFAHILILSFIPQVNKELCDKAEYILPHTCKRKSLIQLSIVLVKELNEIQYTNQKYN